MADASGLHDLTGKVALVTSRFTTGAIPGVHGGAA
jgi:hypothetical protein